MTPISSLSRLALGSICFLSLSLSSLCVVAQAPKYSNEFLAIGVGARSLGMANAYIASTNDGTSAYWNPAGLLNIKSNMQICAMHSEYFAGLAKYDYATLAAPIDKTNVMAFSLIRFGVDDILDTTLLFDAAGNLNYDRVRSFSAADYAFIFSYARKPSFEGLDLGGNAKIIYRKVGSFAHAWGFGLDAGMHYTMKKWKFGLMARDVTSTFNAWSINTDALKDVFATTNNELPTSDLEITLPKALFGLSYKTPIAEKFTIAPELDLDMTFDGKRNVMISGAPISIDPHMGFEFSYSDFIFLRAGINNIQKITDISGVRKGSAQPALGLGIKLKNICIDYALTNLGSQGGLPYSNIFSLKIDVVKHPKS